MFTRKDKEILNTLKHMITLSNEGSIPSMKASSTERIITSKGTKGYANLDNNFRKYTAIKKRNLKKIENILTEWFASMTGEEVYKQASKQCKKAGCPKPNKRVPLDTKFCSYCGKEYK